MIMKRFIYTILLILPIVLNAQNMYNITGLLDNELSGTARFVGMGGSMGALGGNISVMGTNPAGIAVYRSSDFYISGAMGVVNNNTTFNNTSLSESEMSLPLNNLGFVLACEFDDSPVRFFNFGIDHRRKGNLRSKFAMEGDPAGYSQQYVINYLYNQNPFDINQITENSYSDLKNSWLPLLAADVDICDADSNFLVYPAGHKREGELVYSPNYTGYYSEQRGGITVTDFNISANICDQVYIGATVGYHYVDYSRYSSYYEADDEGDIYTIKNDYRMTGSGVDLKLGAIFRPFKYSPFKVGITAHTPVYYSLMDISSATMYGPYDNMVFSTNSSDCYGDDFRIAYSLRTPWRLGAAVSYTFGQYLALNAEYEYADWATTRFSQRTKVGKAQNEEISYNLKSQHTVRFGAEFNINCFALRVGYNYVSAPFYDDAYKYMDNASLIETSTEYLNKFDKHVATVGLGWAGKLFYFDLAYMCQMQKSKFFPYYDIEIDAAPMATDVRTKSHSLVAGVGIRF